MWIFDKLTVRIFTLFLITIAFFLTLVICIPMLDSRNLTYLSTKEKEMGTSYSTIIEKNLSAVPKNSFRWWMRFIVIMDNLQHPGQFLFIITPNKQIITAHSNYANIVRNFNDLSHSTNDPAKKIYETQEIIGPFLIKYNGDDYLLYILQPATSSQSQFANLVFDHPFLLLFLTMLSSSPFLLWLSWSIAKPARRLKKAADQVAKGNIQEWPELETFGSSEFKATGKSFNHMLRELKRMQELQQRLLSDISHELRTPLTRLKLAASLLRRKQGENSELIRIENESQKLDEMIGELLVLARKQYAQNEEKTLDYVDSLFSHVLENAQFEAEQLGKQLSIINPPPQILISCYPQTICSALENVIRNAFRYSFHTIEATFTVKGKYINITIDDDGPGVKEEELSRIFRPFYRTSEARDRESGGTGLGLAIVEYSITQENGQVYAAKSHLGGLQVTIQLPIYQQKSYRHQ